MKYILALALLVMPISSFAGDGHDHGEGAFAGGAFLTSFELPDSVIKNLDIKTHQAKTIDLQESITLPCIVKNPPEQNSVISVTYMSRIEKIHVSLGEKVKKGQTLFTVFSFIAVRDIELKSPIDGVVSAQNVKIGQVVQQDTQIAEIATLKNFFAEGMAYLSDDISHIKVGDVAHIKIDGTHENAVGIIKAFSPIVDSQNKTKSVLAYFDSTDDHIFPNMHCQMDVYLGEPRSALAIPKRAVLGEFGHFFVFIKHGDHFERQDVVLGFESGDNIEILDGLKEGQEVVINGNYQLQFINASNFKTDNHAHEHEDSSHDHEHSDNEDHQHREDEHND